MDKLFLTILNMSLTGAFVIAAICLARLPLKKAPKIISYGLWAVAGFRLLFPYSIESVFSLIPFKAQTIPPDIATQPVPRIDSGIPFINSAVSGMLPAAEPTASAHPLQIWTAIGAWVWLAGVAGLLIYGVVSFMILKRKMSGAARIEANVYEAENIKSPFVLGVMKPRIYLPTGLSEQEMSYILLHEQTHIKRHDHIIKLAAYFVLCLHWFNPLAWAAFLLLGVDMEMSCDERVLKEMGGETKKDYSMSLLSLATERRIRGGSPLAFSEGGLKARIKNVLNFKKPSRVMLTAAVMLAAVFSVGFALNKISGTGGTAEPPSITVTAGDTEIAWEVGKNKWNGAIIDRLDNFQVLMDGQSTGDLVYVPNGERMVIAFSGHTPESASLQEFILIESGQAKYNMPGMDYPIRSDPEIGFVIEPNYVTALSSDSTAYQPGRTIKGYRLVCTWGENECEYSFVIRGDPAITLSFAPDTDYTPTKWVDFYRDPDMPWTSDFEMNLYEFPGVTFRWTTASVTAMEMHGTREMIGGMPVWNVYLADLNGDNLPEFCATISLGSGIIDTRVIVYDYVHDKWFDLSDRMFYDYFLSMENGRLVVTQTRYHDGSERDTGHMAIIEDELVVFGLDRTRPVMDEPKTSTPPG